MVLVTHIWTTTSQKYPVKPEIALARLLLAGLFDPVCRLPFDVARSENINRDKQWLALLYSDHSRSDRSCHVVIFCPWCSVVTHAAT